MEYVLYVVMFLLGCLNTWYIVKRCFGNGEFLVNEQDADKDVYKLMVNDFDKLHTRKYLLVKITRK